MSTFPVFSADLLVGGVLEVQSCMEVYDQGILSHAVYGGHCTAQVPLLTTLVIHNSLNIGQAVQVWLREKERKAEYKKYERPKPNEG